MRNVRRRFFEGVTTALVTPFKGGSIDFDSVKRLIRYQIDCGIEGFVVCGSTGEAATLDTEEKARLLEFVLGEVSGQVPVIVGSGTFNTKESIELAQTFEKIRPNGLLVVTPYYNKPPQRGMAEHFMKIAEATDLPLIIYNVPSRTSIKLEVETVAELARNVENIVGVKEAEGKLDVIQRLKEKCPEDFMILSGDDGTFTEAMSRGAQGVISVISHVVPRWCLTASRAGEESFRAGKKNEQIDKLTKEVKEICDLLFAESNPIPVKWALKEMGIIDSCELRLPLVELDPKFFEPLRGTMRKMGVL